jgi:hypothetical protein
MLSATLENSEKEYSSAIREFLEETYAKIIPDIPDILNASLSNDKILALAKYSSSRDAIDKFLPNSNINLDDKTFFTLALKENEYFKPLPVGQSDKERKKIWNDLHAT